MKKYTEKKNIIIIVIILCAFTYLKLNPSILVSLDLKDRMYYDLKSYKEEIENLNYKLASSNITNNYDLNKLLINDKVLINFEKSKNDAATIGRYSLSYDYDDIYLRYNEIIIYALENGISESEQDYINTLYDYNVELIHEFNRLFEPLNSSDNTRQKFYKNIINIYKEFSITADDILNTEDYSNLKSYKGDFSEFDMVRAEKFVMDTFSMVVPGRELNYNMDDLYDDSLIFSTHAEGNNIDTKIRYREPQYEIKYDKKSREVYIRLVGSIIPSYFLKEEEIDIIAQDIVAKLNYKGSLIDKTVSNIGIPGLSSINYTYTNKNDDVWDKQQDLSIELDSYGLVRELHIVDSDDFTNIYVDITDIIERIKEKADINDIYKIRNTIGELEYIVNITYKGTYYNIIIDGTTGELKSLEASVK